MLDFTELSRDGQDLELLTREILFTQGLRCYWSGKGPDAGRDLLAIEDLPSFIASDEKRWLIQCKHNAHGGGSVGIKDLDGVVDSCMQHTASGYLLVCSTQPSSTVVNRLEDISSNDKNDIVAVYWDAVRIEQILSTAKYWRLAQRFFPISSAASTLQVYATESPNHWVVSFRGYYFHLTNRIGSSSSHHLMSIGSMVNEIESLDMPDDHFIRIRCVYFDDKHGNYTWYLDYMYPHDQRRITSSESIKHALGDGYTRADGQNYSFDVMVRPYLKYSDHYDPDHYDYYKPYINQYLYGFDRDRESFDFDEQRESKSELEAELELVRVKSFETLNEAFKALGFLKVVRSSNAYIEYLDKFQLLRDWSDLIRDLDIESDRFFSAWFLLRCEKEDNLHRLIATFPQDFDCMFRFKKVFVYVPEGAGSELSGDSDLYELTISVNSMVVSNKFVGRGILNGYFDKLAVLVDGFK